MIGRTIGSYKLIGKLGEGGMGAVYKGVDLMVEREVAIKVLRPEIARQPEILERFRAEAVALAKLNHPHIATLYSFFREGDEYFMVMEFVAGRTLESIIRDSAPMPSGTATAIASQVLEAVEHAHSHGILHRDIKPANVMLTSAGQVKVTDFGIARVLGKARLTREGCAYGTLEYLAPERIRGQEGDVRSDLYSLGAVLYEMLSHHLPFERPTDFELMRAHLEEAPPSFAGHGLHSIPHSLEVVVNRALAKMPEDRFANASEFRSALAVAAGEHVADTFWAQASPLNIDVPPRPAAEVPAPAEATPLAPSPITLGKSQWRLYAAGAVALMLMLLVGAFMLNRVRRNSQVTPVPVRVEAPRTPPSTPPQSDHDATVTPGVQQNREPQVDLPKSAPVQNIAGKPAAKTARSNSPAMDKTAQSRREAALKALDGSGSPMPAASQQTKKDRRAMSLDALQK
jgi:eukaryotic-like serine/threonine-protein kinase